MTPNKLHIEPPQDMPGDNPGWKKLEEMIMIILRQKYNLVDADFLCGTRLEEMYTDSQLRDICLLASGTDWPSQVLAIGQLRLQGSGPCPNCGSFEIEESAKPLRRDQETGMLYFDAQEEECGNCHTTYVLQN